MRNNIFVRALNNLREHIYIYSIVVLGTLLRVYHLSYYDLWYDERATLITSVLFNSHIYGLLQKMKFFAATDLHSIIYSFVLSIWIKIVGVSVFKARLLSVIFSVVTIYSVYVLARDLYPRTKRVAQWTSLLTAVSPLYLWYAQELRGYSLNVMLVVLFTIAVLRLTYKETLYLKAEAVLLGLGVVFSHYFGWVFVTILLFTISIYNHKRRETLYRVLAYVFIPYVIYMMVFLFLERGWIYVLKLSWIHYVSLWSPFFTLLEFTLGYSGRGIYLTSFIISVFLLGVALFSKTGTASYVKRLLALMTFVPIVFMFIFSWAVFDIYVTRYVLASSVYYYILLASSTIRNKVSPRIFISLLVLLMVVSCWRYYNNKGYSKGGVSYFHYGVPPKTHVLRDIFSYFDEHSEPGDIFAYSSWSAALAFSCYSIHRPVNSAYNLYSILVRGRGMKILKRCIHVFFLKTNLKKAEYTDKIANIYYSDRIMNVDKVDVTKYKFNSLWLFVSQWYSNYHDNNEDSVIKWCDARLRLVKVIKYSYFELRQYKHRVKSR